MTNALSIRPDQSGFDDTQVAALESLGIAEAPAGDQQLFLHVAQRSGLDPFARQIYLIPRWDSRANKNKWTIQTSIDGLRVIRDRIGKFQGLVTEWCGDDGVWRDVWLSKTKPAAARVSVYVTGFQVPIRGIALWAEYVQTLKNGAVTSMWDSKSTVMLAKCAEAIAYRQAFPQDFSGLYVAEEMPATEQDEDGVYVTTTMRADPPRGNNGSRGRANEARVSTELANEHTPPTAGEPRRGRSRPHEAAGPATTEQWPARIATTTAVRALFALHDEADKAGILDQRDAHGTTIEELFVARRTELQAPKVQEPAPIGAYDEEVPF